MQQLQDIYINFTLSLFEKIEMTKLSKLTDKSHDIFTKNLLLNSSLDDDKRLWESIKLFLRDYENEESGCIVVDDMFIHIKLIKQVVKNGDDGESNYLYLVTNDIDLSFQEVLEIYKRRWKNRAIS